MSTLLVAIWIVCGVLAYGVTYADFMNQFPTLDRRPGRRGELARFSAVYALMGPIGLLVVTLCSGWRYGVQFRGGPRAVGREDGDQ